MLFQSDQLPRWRWAVCSVIRDSKSSAGGQLEQPSEVNSSTTTGVRVGPAPRMPIAAEAESPPLPRKQIAG